MNILGTYQQPIGMRLTNFQRYVFGAPRIRILAQTVRYVAVVAAGLPHAQVDLVSFLHQTGVQGVVGDAVIA